MPTGVLPSGDAVSCEQSAVPRRHHAVRDRGGQDLIAIDWGTSNFRAFRLDESGKIIERRSSTEGILRVQEGRFAETLRAQVGDWLTEGENRVLLCGMVGSRQGWVEAKYLSCPVGLADLADSLVKVHFDGAEVLLIPGVMGTDSDGIPEVMRGEETEAIGILDACGGDWSRLSAGHALQMDPSQSSRHRELYHLHDRRSLFRAPEMHDPVPHHDD